MHKVILLILKGNTLRLQMQQVVMGLSVYLLQQVFIWLNKGQSMGDSSIIFIAVFIVHLIISLLCHPVILCLQFSCEEVDDDTHELVFCLIAQILLGELSNQILQLVPNLPVRLLLLLDQVEIFENMHRLVLILRVSHPHVLDILLAYAARQTSKEV